MADQSLILREYLMPTAGSPGMEANENASYAAGPAWFARNRASRSASC